MKLNENIQLPLGTDRALAQSLYAALQSHARKINTLASGTASGIDVQATAAPTTGTWASGDFVKNSAPSELGSAASKYVILGWMCVAGGTPGTWVQCRCLTGA